MTFDEIIAQTLVLLQREKRLSYRALKRRFGLDDDYLEDLKEELIYAKKLAVDEDGRVLVWLGAPEPTATPVAAPAGEQARPPHAYTPKHLEEILTNRSALEGERKQVTVLFADIADSSQLAQQLDPEVMHQLLDQVLRLMADAVHRYEGTVNQYLGDGLMALFGAPVALEDHAFRAVQAALTIQETIRGYSAQFHRQHGVEVHLRVGLNTGLVVVGRIGDDLRMDYTAVGNTTHVASRLQSLAEPGTILLAEGTYRVVADYVHSEAMGPIEVKGQREPVAVHQVTGRARWRSRLEISAARGLTPLVGRQRELALLHDCLARAEGGRGQVVGIGGEAGVGKSRLLHEFHASLAAGRAVWLIGHCMAHGQSTPYGPILEILRLNFEIEDEDHPLQIQEKLRRGIHIVDPGLTGILPLLDALFGLPGAEDTLRHLEPKEKRQQTFEAIRALAAAASQRRPHVVVIENLHWMDQSSEDFLAFLIESLAGMPLLVLTTHRPGYTVRWAGKTYYTQIALDALTEAETESMVAALLNRHDLPTDLLRFIQAKAGGNPLFIEEIVRSLGGRGLLVRHHDGLHWASDATVEFPTTMQDIMQARIDQLEQPVKRTAQTAAAIGREFGLRLLSQVSEMADELPHHLGILKNAELIHERRFFPELEYRFKHAVIHDVAYQSLLVQRRKVLHGAIGQAIEQLYADRLEEQAAMLAYHYALSERQDKAARYTLLAGDQAARLYANAEATTHYTQALSLARSLPPSPEAQRMQIDATLKLASVGGTRQDLERDLSNLEPAQRLAEALNDAPRLAQVLYWLGRLHYVMWNSPPAIAYARQSLEIADRLGDTTLAAPAVNLLGRLYWQRSDFLQASQMLERSVEQMRQLGNTNEEATAASFAGLVLGSLGQFEQAFSYADHGLRLAQQIHNPLAEAAAYQYRGTIHDQRGEWAQAIAAYQEARRVAERAGDRFRVYLVQFWEGRAHAQAGDPDRGRMLLEESIALAQQIGTNFGLAYQKTFLATCLLALGELDMACRLCHEAIQVAERTDDQRVSAFVHQTLAQALFHLTPADRQPAEHAMLEAIRTSQEIGAQPELARSYLRYARLLQSWGEAAKTREYLTEAIGMFQRMGMGWDVAQAEEVLHMLPKFAPS